MNVQEEVARVESVDATELGETNGHSNSTDPEEGIGTKTSPLDDTISKNNVSIHYNIRCSGSTHDVGSNP